MRIESLMRVFSEPLKRLVAAIFSAAGCDRTEAETVAEDLVSSNLVGHDSHGVIRVMQYIRWLREEKLFANRKAEIVFENEVIAVMDGRFGFGQSIAGQAMDLGIRKSARHGVAVVAVRNSGHMGRIGRWAEIAARAGKISLHFVNANGPGMLVAPHGGVNRRLSASPIAAGIPVEGRDPILLDMSTSAIAEGKLKVAYNKGVPAPEGCIIDAAGRPTTDPKAFYGDPPGALLPFGGHKGYGLGIVVEVLAGALTGGGCPRPGEDQLQQGMLAVILDLKTFNAGAPFFEDLRRYIDFVKSSEKASPRSEILMPGEIEHRTRALRLKEGIDLDEKTWNQIVDVARSLKVPGEVIEGASAR